MTAAAVLAVAAPAAAQTPRDETEPTRGAAPDEGGARDGGWRTYPNERHILVRAGANVGARLSDPFAQGALAPITPYVEGTYAFVHLGSFLLGPTLNFQTGIDKTGAQFAIQPAATLFRRFNNLFGLTARVGVPLLVANHGPSTFGRDDNAFVLVDAEGERELPRGAKLALARALVAEIAARLPRAAGRGP